MRGAAVVLVAAVAFVAAGCGGGGGGKQSATPLDLVSQAVSKTTASSAKFHLAITETAGPIGPLTITADGSGDTAAKTATMTMDLSSIAKLTGVGSTNAAGWQADVILDGTTEYLRLPALAAMIPGGKPWLEIDAAKLSKLKGVDLSQLLQTVGEQDPTQALQLLQSVGNVQKVGEDETGGVDTTKYSGTLDPQKIAAKLGGAGLGSLVGKLGTTPIPVTVWVDSNGYVRKLDESLHAGAADVRIETTLSDFGTKVSVTPPPADQTTDLLHLLQTK